MHVTDIWRETVYDLSFRSFVEFWFDLDRLNAEKKPFLFLLTIPNLLNNNKLIIKVTKEHIPLVWSKDFHNIVNIEAAELQR